MGLYRPGQRKLIASRPDKYLTGALFKEIFKEGLEEDSVKHQLNQFFYSRKLVFKWEVDQTIKKLRGFKLFSAALKLSEVMGRRNMMKTISDHAIHLDLVAKVRGIPAAELYFVNLQESLKDHRTYWSLLNCYCKESMTEKAEALMEKMKELKLPLTAPLYNSFMSLYERIGQIKKIPSIIQEMKDGGIMLETFSYNMWMRAVAASGDITGAERVFDELKRDDQASMDWTSRCQLASIYVDAGEIVKAETVLGELETSRPRDNRESLHFLITLYGQTGNLIAVHRVWRLLRLSFDQVRNRSYRCMIRTLVSLKDLPGAEKCFEEWESSCERYDIRLASILIDAYAKQGLLKKAAGLKERAGMRGAAADFTTCRALAECYLKGKRFRAAADYVKMAIHLNPKWVPSPEVVCGVMGYFESRKDVGGAERFVGVLGEAKDVHKVEVYEALIRTYGAAGKTDVAMRHRVKAEGVELSEVGKKVLDVVCVG